MALGSSSLAGGNLTLVSVVLGSNQLIGNHGMCGKYR